MLKFVMQIYFEHIFISNSLMMIIILIIISRFFKFKTNKFKLIFSSSIYGLTSCIQCIGNFLNLEAMIFQLTTTLFCLSLSYKKISIKKLFQSLLAYIFISNTYTKIMSIINKQEYKYGSLIFSKVNFFISMLSLFVVGIFISKIFDMLLKKKKTNSNIVNGEIYINNKKILTRCYLDSGNTMCFNNKPVSIINYELFNKLTNEDISSILDKNKKREYITINTVCGKQKLIKLELNNLNLKINDKLINNPIFALSLKLNNNYEIILNNNYF